MALFPAFLRGVLEYDITHVFLICECQNVLKIDG